MIRRKVRGGSLVELLTALAVGGLVMSLFLEILLGSFGVRRGGPPPSRWRGALAAIASIRHDVEGARAILSPRRRRGAVRGPALVLATWDGAIVAYHKTKHGLWRSVLAGEPSPRTRLLAATAGLDTTFQYRGHTIRAVRVRLRVGSRMLLASAVPANRVSPPAPVPPHGAERLRRDNADRPGPPSEGLAAWLTRLEDLCHYGDGMVKQ